VADANKEVDKNLQFAYEADIDSNDYTSPKTIGQIIKDGGASLRENKADFVLSVFPELDKA